MMTNMYALQGNTEIEQYTFWLNHTDVTHQPRFDLRLYLAFSGSKKVGAKRCNHLLTDNLIEFSLCGACTWESTETEFI